jgi:hypothetical protein
MHRRGFVFIFVLVVGSALVLGACFNSKVDDGTDMLEDIADLQIEVLETYIDKVDDLYDICNKCVRETETINNAYRGQIQALAAQWEAHKAQITTKEERESVEAARAKIDDTYEQIGEIMEAEETYDIFQKFQKNCGAQTPKVYGRMQSETINMMFKAIGHEL